MPLVRIRHPLGTLKVEFTPENSSLWLYEQVATHLATQYADCNSFWLCWDPLKAEETRIVAAETDALGKSIKHGDLVHLHLKTGSTTSIGTNYSNSTSTIDSDNLDYRLQAQDGLIKRPRDARLCRHGTVGMCEHCQPLEPYDPDFLEKNNVKHLSFYSWLKKQRTGANSAVPLSSLLEEPFYGIDRKCQFHAPYPAGICTKCQPGAIMLRQQPYRMVDHVEVTSPRLIDNFLGGWRDSGYQRFGWLFGRYAEYKNERVPLGIKAVVEYIYEPPQDGSIDGFELLEDARFSRVEGFLKAAAGLECVGLIYTDLVDDGSGQGKVIQRRSKESFFLSSSEVVFLAHQQSGHPCTIPFRNANPVRFSSRFVSLLVTGEADGGIGIKAYQVSDSAAALERENLIAATTDPSLMMMRSAVPLDDPNRQADDPVYVPPVQYKYKNEYGREAQCSAEPFFPVEYLLVTLSEGIPLQPEPLFTSPLEFPGPHMHPNDAAMREYLASFSGADLAQTPILMNVNFCLYLGEAVAIGDSERALLAEAVAGRQKEAFFASEFWQRVLQRVAESAVSTMEAAEEGWSCPHCTFYNEKSGGDCAMCGLPKQ